MGPGTGYAAAKTYQNNTSCRTTPDWAVAEVHWFPASHILQVDLHGQLPYTCCVHHDHWGTSGLAVVFSNVSGFQLFASQR
jgi:hypothetical protein